MKKIFRQFVVSTLLFLARIAAARHNPRIIAVTGSVGKTSTKDAIFAVVSSAHDARKSEKSMNSEIGLPLAVFGLENAWSSASGWASNLLKAARIAFFDSYFPEWLILEVGVDHPGDIQRIGKWLHPDIVVLTRMSETPVHIEFFKDMNEVLEEKMFLAKAMKPSGTLIVNADDPYFMKAASSLSVHQMTYGSSKEADIRIMEAEALYGDSPLKHVVGEYAIISIKGQRERMELLGTIGKHIMYSVAAACAVGYALNIADDLPAVFENLDMPRGRMRVLDGKDKSMIIDDTYNSSPVASVEALRALHDLSVRGKKIAVLGDMKELGNFAETAHKEIGKIAAETLHTLVTVGSLAEHIAMGARGAGMTSERILSFKSSDEAAKAISGICRAGDIILVKGSQSMRMERVVEALLADPAQAKSFLVRQEDEWKKR